MCMQEEEVLLAHGRSSQLGAQCVLHVAACILQGKQNRGVVDMQATCTCVGCSTSARRLVQVEQLGAWCPYSTWYFANRLSGFVMALNSSAFPEGSLKNIVYCSPGCPATKFRVTVWYNDQFMLQCCRSVIVSQRPCNTWSLQHVGLCISRQRSKYDARVKTWCCMLC